MRVISFFDSENKEHWIEEIRKSDWNASTFLAKMLTDGTFFETVGEGSEVLLLVDGDVLVSHCTFSKYDDIQPTELTPWIGFVYTFEKYRGNRYAGLLFREAERLAKERSVKEIYLSTNHTGLYEKYGFEYKTMLDDIEGNPSRIYVKHI